jgi:putative ABC transport system permease protein
MLQNYFIVALRNILKHKFYSILNLLGLASGLTSCFLIGLYIFDELNFDKFHKNYQDIYHVGLHVNFGGQEYKMASACPPLALEMITGIPGVEEVTRLTDNVFPGMDMIGVFRAVGTTRDLAFPSYYADHNHVEVLKIELAQGRFFSKELASDSLACVINETAAKELGWTNPLNEKLTEEASGPVMHVIGVVKDFNFESFKLKVKPLVILPLKERSHNMLIRYSGNAKDAIASIETIWKKYAPNEPYEYTFLDQNFDKLYHEEQRLGKLFTLMSGIATFVACLGLLGLASFTAEQRTKEIGIRKVLGASVTSINSLLSKEVMMLVGI